MTKQNKAMKLMVVDDEPEIVRSIMRYLSFHPSFAEIEIEEATTFEEALRILEENNPVIILQDINLPDGNGLQFIRQAKKKYPIVQFIVITGASDLDRAMEALAYGAADYLKKPLDMELLSVVVGEAVNRSTRWGELLWSEYQAEEVEEE
jgi:DNA-binding NtrC family response regulator